MGLTWNTLDVEGLTRSGVLYFNSKMEMLEGLYCKMYKLNSFRGLWTHFHDYFQIWYIPKGEFIHTVHGHPYHIGKGDLFIIPPNTLHSIDVPSELEIEIIGCEFMPSFINEGFSSMPEEPFCFDTAYLEHFLQTDNHAQYQISLDSVTEDRIRSLLLEMLHEYERRSPFFETMLKANLLLILSILIRQVNGRVVKAGFEKLEKYKDIMSRAVEYIHNNYHEDIKLEEVSALSNLSRSTFCSLFKEWTGKTFNRYLTDIRISNAKILLKQREFSVTDVCYATGFNELSYFCRIFKKYTGLSPNYYRKQAIQ